MNIIRKSAILIVVGVGLQFFQNIVLLIIGAIMIWYAGYIFGRKHIQKKNKKEIKKLD
mgnify:CR=1 FL=1